MAYKDTININGHDEPAVNIRWVVGPRASNGPADVMLVQTLFHYLSYEGSTPTRKHTGLDRSQLPAMDGRFGAKTSHAVTEFQRKNARFLQNVDGLVHPADYKGRRLSEQPRFLTITLMHLLAQECALFSNEPNYINGLIKLNPVLKPWLG